MASSSGGGASLPIPDARSDVSTDEAPSESESSYIGSDGSEPIHNTCAWRTAEFYDQECSRYFDCPSHVVERSLSDSEPSGDEDDAAPIGDTAQAPAETGHEDDSDDDQHQRLAIRSDSTPSSPESGHPTPVDASSRSSGTPSAPSADAADPDQPREASESRLSLPDRTSSLQSSPSLPPNTTTGPSAPLPLDYGTSPSHRLRDFEAHRTPEPRQSTLSPRHRPGGPPRNFSDILLPRWQPDSEATLCPICRTQFSFFVRKHHCRFVVCPCSSTTHSPC